MKGPPHKVLTIPESKGDWDSVRDVKSYCCDAVYNKGSMNERFEGYLISHLVAAENATLLPKLGSPKMKESVQASQTVLIGDLVLGSTLWKNLCPGIPPSRAKAYIIRELDVMENTLVRGRRLIVGFHEEWRRLTRRNTYIQSQLPLTRWHLLDPPYQGRSVSPVDLSWS